MIPAKIACTKGSSTGLDVLSFLVGSRTFFFVDRNLFVLILRLFPLRRWFAGFTFNCRRKFFLFSKQTIVNDLFFPRFFFLANAFHLPGQLAQALVCVIFTSAKFFSKFISPIKKAFLTEDVLKKSFIMTRLKDVMKVVSSPLLLYRNVAFSCGLINMCHDFLVFSFSCEKFLRFSSARFEIRTWEEKKKKRFWLIWIIE